MRPLAAAVLFFGTAGMAQAGDMTFEVKDSSGRPAANAVVLVRPAKASVAPRAAGASVMAQQDVAFTPYVLVAPLGAAVSFPNRDKVRHHVYSFSAAKRFELKLYGRDETRTVTFDKPGPVALGCNIHDRMAAFIYVADTPYAAKTDAEGRVVLKGVPAGPATLTVWHPLLKARTAPARPLTVVAGPQREAVRLDLRAAT